MKCQEKIMRIIARLDIKNNYLIKGIQFEGLRKIGEPSEYAYKYYKQGADEIILHDAVASLYGRNALLDVIDKITNNIFIPITVSGGIRTLQDIEMLLKAGADKVAINTYAIKNPSFLKEASQMFGSQAIVLSVDAKKIEENKWEAFTDGGRERVGLDVMDWIKTGVELGVGELLLTSVDMDGTEKGFDIKLITEVNKISTVPVILSGGFGKIEHILEAYKQAPVSGMAFGSMLHYEKITVEEIKACCQNNNIIVR